MSASSFGVLVVVVERLLPGIYSVCSLLWWLWSERQLVPARLFGVFVVVVVVE